MTYSYLMPDITAAPPPHYTLSQFLPLAGISGLIDRSDAVLQVRRQVIIEGNTLLESEDDLVLAGGEWQNPEVSEFRFEALRESEWTGNGSIGFLETAINAKDGATFKSRQQPSTYTVYTSSSRKTFFSDNRLKFSDNVIISQIAQHGQWLDGYPVCVVDPKRDLGESVLLLNPFERPAVATFEFEGLDHRPRFRIPRQSGRRIDFAQCLGSERLPWEGQFYVSGRNRLIPFFVKHSLYDPTEISTIEHSDAYRGERLWRPFTRALHHSLTWPTHM